MRDIHPTACVSPSARLGKSVTIGPYVVVESDVEIGEGSEVDAHTVIKSGTTLGRDNRIGAGCVLGGLAQHKSPPPVSGRLVMGDRNMIREHVTIHRGLHAGHLTQIGSDCLLMVNAHVAHDCVVGDHVILANNVMLAGHITVGDRAYMSGASAAHQFCRIGTLAMVGGQAHLTKDVPPYVTVDGVSSMIVGLNSVGLRRAGFTADDLRALKEAYRLAFRSGLRWEAMLEEMRAAFPTGHGATLCEFLAGTQRGCVMERSVPRRATLKLHATSESAGEDVASETVRRAA